MPSTRRFIWRVDAALGANLTADPATYTWTDVTRWARPGVTNVRGRADQFSTPPPSQLDVGLNNDGRWVIRNPTGPWYGLLVRNTPLRLVYVDSAGVDHVQGSGFLGNLPLTWADNSLSVSYVDAVASGALQRIQQQKDLRSALFRAHAQAAGVVGYWPMEEMSGATAFAPGIAAGVAAPFADVQPGSSATDGSSSLPVFGGASHVFFNVPSYAPTTAWSVRFVFKVPASPLVNGQVLSWLTPTGTIVRWQITLIPGTPDTVRLEGYDAAGTAAYVGPTWNFVDSTNGAELSDGRQLYFALDAQKVGPDIDVDWDVWYRPDAGFVVSTSTGQSVTVAGQTIGNVTSVYYDGANGFSAGGVVLGHVAVGTLPGLGNGTIGAAGGAGEMTTTRFLRLCAEQGIPAFIGEAGITAPAVTQPMGPQPTISFKDQLTDIAETEFGLLLDAKDSRLQLIGRRSRFNHPVTMTLDVAAGEVAWPFRPADDDFAFKNSVSVSRRSGSLLAVAVDGDSITQQGEYQLSATINPLQDADGIQHAQWRLALGTVDEMRYSRVTIDLLQSPQLITQWLACDVGSRIRVTGVPTQGGLPPDDLDLILEGYTETADSVSWRVDMNCSPARGLNVFTVEAGSGNLGAAGTSGSALLAGYDAAATSLLVATTTSGARWSTARSYDWAVGGEQIRVGSMATNTSAFVAAGTAAHADNATVTPALPAGVQKGDLLLVFAAIRSTSAAVTAPAGYTVLLTDGNVVLLGKIHSGTESAPAISFTGGVAGDTTSAQMAAFRYTQCLALLTATSTNVAAQNILVPAALPPRHRCVALWLGWKQDDWTSVATFSGTEIGEPSTTTGNDQGLVWDYSIQTTATEVAGGQFVVTGGAAAASRGYVVWLPTDVQTATVTRAVNGVSKAQTAGTAVKLWKPGRVAL